jgi:hypothetical protein
MQMINEQDKITVSGIDYYPISAHQPLAISRCGLCLNVETMKNRKWAKSTTVYKKEKMDYLQYNSKKQRREVDESHTSCKSPGSMLHPNPKRTSTHSSRKVICYSPRKNN